MNPTEKGWWLQNLSMFGSVWYRFFKVPSCCADRKIACLPFHLGIRCCGLNNLLVCWWKARGPRLEDGPSLRSYHVWSQLGISFSSDSVNLDNIYTECEGTMTIRRIFSPTGLFMNEMFKMWECLPLDTSHTICTDKSCCLQVSIDMLWTVSSIEHAVAAARICARRTWLSGQVSTRDKRYRCCALGFFILVFCAFFPLKHPSFDIFVGLAVCQR